MKKNLLAIGLLCTLLSACGFHLRGSGGSSLAAGTPVLFQAANPDGPLARQLQRSLEGAGATLVSAENGMQARRLHVLAERTAKRELTLNTAGQVTEYELTLFVDYTVAAPGMEEGQPQTLSVSRPYTYDRTQVLAVNQQENFLLNDMYRDLSDQLIRRLERAGKQ